MQIPDGDLPSDGEMASDGELDEILRLLRSLEIDVRFEHVGGRGGGLCGVGKQRVFFVDLDADSASKFERAVDALRELPDWDTHYLSPALRERLKAD